MQKTFTPQPLTCPDGRPSPIPCRPGVPRWHCRIRPPRRSNAARGRAPVQTGSAPALPWAGKLPVFRAAPDGAVLRPAHVGGSGSMLKQCESGCGEGPKQAEYAVCIPSAPCQRLLLARCRPPALPPSCGNTSRACPPRNQLLIRGRAQSPIHAAARCCRKPPRPTEQFAKDANRRPQTASPCRSAADRWHRAPADWPAHKDAHWRPLRHPAGDAATPPPRRRAANRRHHTRPACPKGRRPLIQVRKRPWAPNAHASTSPRFLGNKFLPRFLPDGAGSAGKIGSTAAVGATSAGLAELEMQRSQRPPGRETLGGSNPPPGARHSAI